jgi:hypothetical protein
MVGQSLEKAWANGDVQLLPASMCAHCAHQIRPAGAESGSDAENAIRDLKIGISGSDAGF